jgi:hypothetical protein
MIFSGRRRPLLQTVRGARFGLDRSGAKLFDSRMIRPSRNIDIQVFKKKLVILSE